MSAMSLVFDINSVTFSQLLFIFSVLLLFAAIAAFRHTYAALHRIYKVKRKRR